MVNFGMDIKFCNSAKWPQCNLRNKLLLLYLPTQIHFLIGGERVTCHWSKLHDALGRTKLHDALGQQQLELSTHT